MSEYRIRETGAVVTESEFRTMHQNTSFPYILTEELVNDFGADIVFEGSHPTSNKYQIIYRDGVEQIEGKWYTKYSVADMDADAIAATDAVQWANIRSIRNQLLVESDWSGLTDCTLPDEKKADWVSYRQALRDITTQTDPFNITWPTKPE